jgi:hypothetical protein
MCGTRTIRLAIAAAVLAGGCWLHARHPQAFAALRPWVGWRPLVSDRTAAIVAAALLDGYAVALLA